MKCFELVTIKTEGANESLYWSMCQFFVQNGCDNFCLVGTLFIFAKVFQKHREQDK